MEILQLKYFYESAKNQSFSKTAQKYMVPVSSVSASVKRLEKELRTSLFNRTGNRITLNEKGEQFFLSTKRALDELYSGVNAVLEEPLHNQTLKILVKTTRETLVRRITQFSRFYPTISFKLNIDTNSIDIENYDFIVALDDEDLKDYEHIVLHRVAIRVETLSTDLLCNSKITLKQLENKPFVTTNTHGDIFEIFTKECERQGFTPKVILECNDYACRDICILAGGVFGLTMGNTTNSSLPNVQYLDVIDFNKQITTKLFYRKEDYKGAVKLFVDFLKSL